VRARIAALLLLALVAGCSSVPPLEDWERFQVSCQRAEKEPGRVLVTVRAKNPPPPPIGHILVGKIELVEGDVILEIKGWRGPRPGETAAEQVLVATVGIARPNATFTFTLLDRGHKDVYKITVPATGDCVVEPASGEFSERG
jgi:hypothetical protein